MDSLKWLKRKFPDSHEEILESFNKTHIDAAKQYRRRFGRLTKDVRRGKMYKAGTLCVWYRIKETDDDGIWTGDFELYCIVKCEPGYTFSGFHSFMPFCEIEEIKSSPTCKCGLMQCVRQMH